MTTETVMTDVRAAKLWVESQAGDFADHARMLANVERDYLARAAAFAKLPHGRPDFVTRAIEGAPLEPGGELLGDTRPTVRRAG